MVTRTWTATNGTGQIHFYGGGQGNLTNHWENLDFSNITRFSHGHHARSGGGTDTYNFQNLDNVRSVVVGRLEDFDASRDQIRIEGQLLDFNNLPSNVRIVEFNGGHNDPNSQPQQWLLISTSSGGHIFYSLEGARVDMNGNGGANNGSQENHFIWESQLPDFSTLNDVNYSDPQNVVPHGYAPLGGTIINDVDADSSDVLATIFGSSYGDLIAAGLNDDNVKAGSGNDRVWGGSGNDTINGDNGNDTIWGGGGKDKIIGGRGNDRLYGGEDADVLSGWGGNDLQYGQNGNDRLYGQQGNDSLFGGAGNDKLFGSTDNDILNGGSGNDLLNGGQGTDALTGGGGADTFEFKPGDLIDWDNITGTWSQKNEQLDTITDFVIGQDRIEFDGFSNVDSLSDLRAWKTTIEGNVYFTVQVRDTNERILVDVDDNTTWSQFMDIDNFLFT